MSDQYMLPLEKLTLDPRIQPRARYDTAVIETFVEDLKRDVVMPPVVVFFDGVKHYLADGWFRFHAHKQAGRSHIPAVVKPGGFREARLYAAGANATNGVRLTLEDKRRAVLAALEEMPGESNAKIAAHCHVSPTMVFAARKALEDAQKAKEEAGAKRREAAERKANEPVKPAKAEQTEDDSEDDSDHEFPVVSPDEPEPDSDEDQDGEDSEVLEERAARAWMKFYRFAAKMGRDWVELGREFEAAGHGEITRHARAQLQAVGK